MYLPPQALLANKKLQNLETTQVGTKYAPYHVLQRSRTHDRKTMWPNAQVMYVMSFLCYRPFMLPRQWLYHICLRNLRNFFFYFDRWKIRVHKICGFFFLWRSWSGFYSSSSVKLITFNLYGTVWLLFFFPILKF